MLLPDGKTGGPCYPSQQVVALQDVLAEQGVDTDEILAKVEEEYGFGEEEEEDQEL